ncbi:FAD:protein FMN transferase [Ectothiorhodospiraceae bacterium WFHF3C12]|nr:FAD:protein FMN transferase [Ectothiorhodospiraceae bacterium WFHF3C12]
MPGVRRSRAGPILVVLTLALAGCGREPQLVDRQFLAFGTLVDVSVFTRSPERAHRAIDQVREALQRWHETWHPWRGEGLARINRRLAAGRPAELSPEIRDMLVSATRYHRLSGGRFDPALAGLVRLWGFNGDEDPPSRPPADAALRDWLAERGSVADLTLREDRVTPAGTGVQLDLGGFAKGYALDRAVAMFQAAGVENAIINAGGDLRVMGQRGGRAWRVGIRGPRGGGVFAAVEAADGEAVFTSGDYERFFEWRGRRYHHILDPETGRPARGLRSVTVITNAGGLADAAATALFVAGREWPAAARDLGLDQVMAVTDDGTVEVTPAMAGRIRFVDARPDRVEEVSWQ